MLHRPLPVYAPTQASHAPEVDFSKVVDVEAWHRLLRLRLRHTLPTAGFFFGGVSSVSSGATVAFLLRVRLGSGVFSLLQPGNLLCHVFQQIERFGLVCFFWLAIKSIFAGSEININELPDRFNLLWSQSRCWFARSRLKQWAMFVERWNYRWQVGNARGRHHRT